MTVAGVLAGLFSAGILALVTHALNERNTFSGLMIGGFVALAAAKIFANAASQLLLVKFSQTTILDLSLTLCEKVLNAPLRVIERHGSARVLATLTDDVGSVTWAVQALPQLAMSASIVLGCSVYLAWLSPKMFIGITVVALLGVIVYKVLHTRAFKHIHAARDARSELFDHFRDLTGGIKELMLHRQRRNSFLNEEIRESADIYRVHNLVATRNYSLAEAWVQTLYHGLMALVLFAFPAFMNTTPEVMTGYMFSMLYMMTPLWNMIGTFPVVARGKVALEKIEELGTSIDVEPTTPKPSLTDSSASANHVRLSAPKPATISMKGVTFSYDKVIGDGDQAFALGPIDFRLEPGELVFVIGGNGSGKSTFVKVLTGLYAPNGGELRVNDTDVSPERQEWYREHFSVVFADCFVFDKLLGLTAPGLKETTQKYLELLQIDHKVSLHETSHGLKFSTTALSSGQRKRLALVTTYVEDRPVYVFDEWAADQDPEYKKIFYSKLLPDLRNRGKSVVVITHDDRYFPMGDRVVKLDDGEMYDWTAPKQSDETSSTTQIAESHISA